MICTACLGAKKINGEDCPVCKGEGQIDKYETPTLTEVLDGEDLLNMEERDWQQLIEKLGGEIVHIDLSQTGFHFINPLDPDGETKSKLTPADIISPWGTIKPYDEVSHYIDISYEEWKHASDKIEEFRKVLES
ncbi:hypothetical protein EHV15_35300 [Paenibacillus oralis]|uniref:Uncharacterized protein n=1 Tax=Paenibacillus oralis TaxID=2490856 RepID=A0A3P3TA71_9BACL|nr:hypothetical protein [Paenibacillus oralis]RRJ54842.1 hypothetical protein EHV15_35300 [Paenibacillus oralis]